MLETIIFICSLISGTVSIIACIQWGRWCKAYWRLHSKYNDTRTENIKLHHEVFRLTYKIPKTEKR